MHNGMTVGIYMQPVPITPNVVIVESRSGPDVQHYVIKFVSDLRQVFLRVLRFPPPIKLKYC